MGADWDHRNGRSPMLSRGSTMIFNGLDCSGTKVRMEAHLDRVGIGLADSGRQVQVSEAPTALIDRYGREMSSGTGLRICADQSGRLRLVGTDCPLSHPCARPDQQRPCIPMLLLCRSTRYSCATPQPGRIDSGVRQNVCRSLRSGV